MSILQTIDLKKYYGTEPNITRALDGVNFSVEDGEFVAVVGTSGSGKSTLLHMMGGLDTPTSGNVIVRDKELSKMNDEQLTIFRRRNIGFIFQNYNLVPILNVYENIVLPVELDGDTVDQKFLDEIVHLLGLEDKADVAAAEDGKLFVVHFRQFFIPDNDIAGSGSVQPAHHVKQGRLAAAGGSHNGHKFAVIYREVHAVKGAGDIRLCTVILFQVDSL